LAGSARRRSPLQRLTCNQVRPRVGARGRLLPYGSAPSRRIATEPVAPYWFSAPSTSLRPVEHRLVDPSIDALDLEVFPGLRADSIPEYRVGPPTGLLPFRSLTDYRLPRGARVNTLAARHAATSHEVWGSFSTTHLSSPHAAGLPHPLRSVSRVSHPPDGFLLDRLTGLVSCRSAHGVPHPSELFPHTELPRLSARAGPLAVHARSGPGASRLMRVDVFGEGHAACRPPAGGGDPFTTSAGACCEARLQGFVPRGESVASARR
jgi:hypothetical protein